MRSSAHKPLKSIFLIFLYFQCIYTKVDEGSIVVHMKSVNVTVPFSGLPAATRFALSSIQ